MVRTSAPRQHYRCTNIGLTRIEAQDMNSRGRLVLESGLVLDGMLLGAPIDGPRSGEVVFNTCMTGYQEMASVPPTQARW